MRSLNPEALAQPKSQFLNHVRYKNLVKLDLSENLLTAIPSELGYLTNLKFLNLSNNRIVQLPATLCCLCKLELFFMNNNCMVSLPMGLKRCNYLKVLSMRNNFMLAAQIQLKGFHRIPTTVQLENNQPAQVQPYLPKGLIFQPLKLCCLLGKDF